jgi:hypothetical protein
MRLWRLELSGDSGLLADALVLAPDPAAAANAVMSSVNEHRDQPVRAVRTIHEVDLGASRVLDLHMPNTDVAADRAHHAAPRTWRVPYRDGRFHRPAGAALVVADDAPAAEELVAAADPFEGQPFYGVPAEYGPAEPFAPRFRTSSGSTLTGSTAIPTDRSLAHAPLPLCLRQSSPCLSGSAAACSQAESR